LVKTSDGLFQANLFKGLRVAKVECKKNSNGTVHFRAEEAV